jgi:hypothetical protein
MSWRVVGYHDATGYRTVMPLKWPTKEKAEEVRKVSELLVAPGFRLVVEECQDEST